jgi:hypothetical protein
MSGGFTSQPQIKAVMSKMLSRPSANGSKPVCSDGHEEGVEYSHPPTTCEPLPVDLSISLVAHVVATSHVADVIGLAVEIFVAKGGSTTETDSYGVIIVEEQPHDSI